MYQKVTVMTINSKGLDPVSRIDTQNQNRARKTWRQVFSESAPLPVAHDSNGANYRTRRVSGL
jgi:hypothetical protein